MAAAEPKGHGQHSGMWIYPDAKVISQDVSEKSKDMAKPFRTALVVTGILFILAIVGFIARAADDGFDEIGPWGYYTAFFSMIFMVTS